MRSSSAYFDASMGTGTVVIGLTSMIIGTGLFGRSPARVTSGVRSSDRSCTKRVWRGDQQRVCRERLKTHAAVLFLIILVLGMGAKEGERQMLQLKIYTNILTWF